MTMNNKPEPKCNQCGSGLFRKITRVRKYWIIECPACGCLYTYPPPQANYNKSETNSLDALRIYKDIYWPKRLNSAKKFLNYASEYSLTNILLDVGCGWGFFLNEAHKHKWQVKGIEIAQDQANWARSNFGFDIFPTFEDFKDGQFDVITLWDVLEHIVDTRKILEECNRCLRPGGLLFIKSPNAEGLTGIPVWWKKGFYLIYWNFVYPANPYEHIYHFTYPFLKKNLGDASFSVIKTQFNQDWNERILAGRNEFIAWCRTIAMWTAMKKNMPYEMSIWAEKNR
jgi:SAM-dependent methyltransferase